jgi:flagellin-like hook-associated protein FlgL
VPRDHRTAEAPLPLTRRNVVAVTNPSRSHFVGVSEDTNIPVIVIVRDPVIIIFIFAKLLISAAVFTRCYLPACEVRASADPERVTNAPETRENAHDQKGTTMSGIILSAAVRQNLLSLQDTASLMATTQQRLATGKKVNSALDNPGAFFTSQALSARASDLQNVLNQIGQAVQTINAANNGITSITQLVQSAKSLAQQAQATTAATSTYSSVDTSSNILSTANLNGTETVATTTGTANLEALPTTLTGQTVTETVGALTSSATIAPVANSLAFTAAAESVGSFQSAVDLTGGSGSTNTDTISVVVNVNGVNTTFTTAALTANESQSAFITSLQGASDGHGHVLSSFATIAANGTGISITTANVATNLTITANADTAAAGLTVDGTTNRSINSTNLASIIGGTGNTLAVSVNGVTTTMTIDATHVQTLAQLNTALGAISGVTAAAASGAGGVTFSQTAGAGKTLGLTVSSAAVSSALGLNTAATGVNLSNGTNRGGLGAALTRTYNSDPTLAEIDPTNLTAGGTSTLNIVVATNDGNAATTKAVTIHNNDNLAAAVAEINGTAGLGATGAVTASIASNKLVLTANSTNIDFTTKASNVSTALGLTTNNATDTQTNSQSLFHQLDTASSPGSAQGETLVISGTNSAGTAFASTITFGTSGGGQVATLAQLNTALTAAGGSNFSAAVTSGHISITQGAGSKSTLTVGGTVDTLTGTAAILENGVGTVFGTHDSQKTLADLDSVNLAGGGALNFTINGKAFTVGLAAGDRVDDVISKLNSSVVGAQVTFSKTTDNSGHDHIKLTGADASVAVTVNANNTSAALGLTTDNVTNNTPTQSDLLTLLSTKLGGGGAGQGKTLTVQVNGGATQTITFGTGTNQVQTVAQLNTQLGALSGVTASVTNGGALDINVASGSQATSLTLGGTAAASLGINAGTQSGTVLSTTANAARTSLQNQYNNVLSQIDTLAKDSSFNGVNLLGGDNMTIAFNEDGSSSQTITGTTVSSANLGLNKLNGTQFQDNTQLDTIVSQTDTAVTQLATQGSQLGSALTIVQARQSFTTAMENTLQTGSDNLVLADTNQEGANMLALQTRQQLSTTALSLANQANQAVLRLFG